MFHLGADPESRRLLRSRLYLLGLAAAFAGPLLISLALYYNPQLRGDVGGDSHGTLILPPQPLTRELFRTPSGPPRWTLLYLARATTCDLHCEATLFMARQVHQSLASRRDRVQVMLLFPSPKIQAGHAPRLRAFRAEQLRALPPGRDAQLLDTQPGDALYIVDPLGNLLMRYDDTATSRGILRDLKRLLAASRIG